MLSDASQCSYSGTMSHLQYVQSSDIDTREINKAFEPLDSLDESFRETDDHCKFKLMGSAGHFFLIQTKYQFLF